jgi:hypothetical protein
MAPMLNKSASGAVNPAKRVAAPAPQPKGKESIRPSSNLKPGPASSTIAKMGPTSFRTAPAAAVTEHQASSTITLVNPQGERKPLGPPSRPSALPGTVRQSYAMPLHQQHPHQQHQQYPAPPQPAAILQQSRVTLQSALEQKAIDMQSEDIVLPDIASE